MEFVTESLRLREDSTNIVAGARIQRGGNDAAGDVDNPPLHGAAVGVQFARTDDVNVSPWSIADDLRIAGALDHWNKDRGGDAAVNVEFLVLLAIHIHSDR